MTGVGSSCSSYFVGRSLLRRLADFLTFPLRAMTLFEKDKWGLSSLASDRFRYVAREVRGYCLDVGCGRRVRQRPEEILPHPMVSRPPVDRREDLIRGTAKR